LSSTAAAAFVCSATLGKLSGSHLNRLNWLPFKSALTDRGYIADPEKREHLLQDAAARVSEVLFRIANSVDLTGLSLEVDLAGVELAHAGEAREQGEVKKAG
jgi:hypothetical protein